MRPKGTKIELEHRRREAVALLAQGMGVRLVARQVNASPGSVVRWRNQYRQYGEEGLRAKPHPGAKPKLSAADRERLATLLLEGPVAHGYRTNLWTLARIAQVIETHFGVHYHPCHVFRVLRSMGWSCQKPQRRARERDEAAIARFRTETWPRLKKSP